VQLTAAEGLTFGATALLVVFGGPLSHFAFSRFETEVERETKRLTAAGHGAQVLPSAIKVQAQNAAAAAGLPTRAVLVAIGLGVSLGGGVGAVLAVILIVGSLCAQHWVAFHKKWGMFRIADWLQLALIAVAFVVAVVTDG
jgi:hypothetical protein